MIGKNSITLTRKELYDKVWKTPMTKLAKEFNLSDNGLRKICKNFDIPIPPVGHWQKVQYGKKLAVTPLANQKVEKEIKINIDESKSNNSNENPIRNLATEKIRNNTSLIFKLGDRLLKPDEIVLKAQSNLNTKKVSNSYEQVKGTISTDRGLPSIIVTPKNVSRALRILDNLIKNFKILSYQVVLNDDGLKIMIHEADYMSVYIREKSNAIFSPNKYGWNDRELIANGKLAIKFGKYNTFEFVDTEKSQIEDQIEKILIKIETKFQEMLENRKRWKIQAEEQERIKKIKEEKQKLKDEEYSKFVSFYDDAHRWKKFLILREYLDYVISSDSKTNGLKKSLTGTIKP